MNSAADVLVLSSADDSLRQHLSKERKFDVHTISPHCKQAFHTLCNALKVNPAAASRKHTMYNKAFPV